MHRRFGLMIFIGLGLAARPAAAERELCRPAVRHHGAAVDLELKDADIHDVLRLLADVGKLNLVVSSEVSGKVTLHLRKVAWDRAACAIAGTHRLSIVIDGTILIVNQRQLRSGSGFPASTNSSDAELRQ
ncbi:MAG: hypothetical protein H0T79_16040 [Deltaproteobacteria bacterium]|nr:hypothetical protein [Deltaproteobacteria bacterium]